MSSRPVYDCKACGYCENGAMQCAVKDDYVNEWIKNGCKDEIEFIEKIIIDCVLPQFKKI